MVHTPGRWQRSYKYRNPLNTSRSTWNLFTLEQRYYMIGWHSKDILQSRTLLIYILVFKLSSCAQKFVLRRNLTVSFENCIVSEYFRPLSRTTYKNHWRKPTVIQTVYFIYTHMDDFSRDHWVGIGNFWTISTKFCRWRPPIRIFCSAWRSLSFASVNTYFGVGPPKLLVQPLKFHISKSHKLLCIL